jgi:K+-transporting ATPase ATPase C chain
LATAWVNADPTHATFVDEWSKKHPEVVAQFVKDNPATPEPKAPDLAVVFFENFSKAHPGKFLSAVQHQTKDGKTETVLEPVQEGTDIQSIFFDMWRNEHPDVALQDVPGDMVTTSGSGLDPNITLQNAEYQLDRVVGAWTKDTKRDEARVREQVNQILQADVTAPFYGLIGEKMVNVMEVNLELRKHFGAPPA